MLKILKKIILVCVALVVFVSVVIAGSVIISRILAPNPKSVAPKVVKNIENLIKDLSNYYAKHGSLDNELIYAKITNIRLVKKDGSLALDQKISLNGSPTAFIQVGDDTTCIGVGVVDKAGDVPPYIQFFTLGQVTDMPQPLCKAIRNDASIQKFTENSLLLPNGVTVLGAVSLGK